MRSGRRLLAPFDGTVEHALWDDVDTEFLLGLPYLEVPVVLGQLSTHTVSGTEYKEYALTIKGLPEDQSRVHEVMEKMTRFHLNEDAKRGRIVLRATPDITSYQEMDTIQYGVGLKGKRVRMYMNYAVER